MPWSVWPWDRIPILSGCRQDRNPIPRPERTRVLWDSARGHARTADRTNPHDAGWTRFTLRFDLTARRCLMSEPASDWVRDVAEADFEREVLEESRRRPVV